MSTLLHAWHTIAATPLWLKFAVIAVVAVCAAFPAALLAVRRVLALAFSTELGRAVLLSVALIAYAHFRAADAFADGRAVELAAQKSARLNDAARIARLELQNHVLNDAATERARASSDDRTKTLNAGLAKAQGIAREPRAPVPAVCPEPDARLVRLLAERDEGAARLEGELRAVRSAPGGAAGSTARKP